jgi:hypothetical protein
MAEKIKAIKILEHMETGLYSGDFINENEGLLKEGVEPWTTWAKEKAASSGRLICKFVEIEPESKPEGDKKPENE